MLRSFQLLLVIIFVVFLGSEQSQAQDRDARAIYSSWQEIDKKFIIAAPFGVSTYGGRAWTNLNSADDTDWYSISTTDVISSTHNLVTAWMRGHHRNNPKVKYRTTMFQQVFNCSARKMRTPIYIEYGADGEILYRREDYGREETAVPGTHGDHWLDVACGNK